MQALHRSKYCTSVDNVTAPSVLPKNIYVQKVGENAPKGAVTGRCVTESYEQAVAECESKVRQIVAECKRMNIKYTDPHFDLDDQDYCLNSLTATADPDPNASEPDDQTVTYDVTQKATSTGGPIYWGNVQPASSDQNSVAADVPACARRVGWIFDEPQFFRPKGANVKAMRQGAEGDCWFISSLGSLCVDEEVPHLIEKICPATCRDEKVGVYGFVFSRDGEWISEIIDDKLYLKAPDYDDCSDDRRSVWDSSHSRLAPEVSRKLWRRTFQSNSDALFYASCAHPQETWVPLIEKAFAKAHGDFNAIDGGWPGEGVEDLTGGITQEIVSDDIYDKDLMWTEGLLQVNKHFLFGAGTREYGHPDPSELGRQGIEDGHAYSVLRAVEYEGVRLLMVKNPWGETEWNGKWSDGSKEWTPDAIKKLDYKFGNDGIFWMPFDDFLERFVQFWRTRLFSHEWLVSQHWTTVQVPWSGDYNDTSFEFAIAESTHTVIVLSQLDSRYFMGLSGQYAFTMAFRVHRSDETEYIVRGYSSGDRSAVAEVALEKGKYEVKLQIQGFRDSTLPKVEDVVKQNWLSRRDKLIRIGMSYDLAHAKGQIEDADKKADNLSAAVAAPISNDPPPTAQQAPITVQSVDSEPLGGGYDAAGDPASIAPADPPVEKPLEPWNAPLVVGLRVFCHNTSAVINVKTVKPDTVETKGRLDIDDAEKDAVAHAESVEKKVQKA
ncbi:Calpain-type cysteine protease DEK1 [Hyphodiscus hymeniophilus]|uniref:Calpain-type cysteine protease DEK1 n=1 Tax=Hyphodiscus hymeniophilus TaxID=353542 RepID=A0A9P7B042_9HELO|nr:Calpain-type cysteine protease DEK1 [Hyphodiscus hymeniophilus]